MRHIFLVAALVIATPALAQDIQVQNAWARATAPNGAVGGVFFTLIDNGAPDRLVGVSSPVAGTGEVHETIADNGVMKMRPVPGLALQTGQTVAFKPGSYHVMLMGLKQQLKPGESFPVTLNFEKAAPVTVMVTIGAAGAAGPAMQHGMHVMPKP